MTGLTPWGGYDDQPDDQRCTSMKYLKVKIKTELAQINTYSTSIMYNI